MQQLTIDGQTEYHWPLTPDERQELFDQWRALNPEAVSFMERQALRLQFMGKTVSTRYLFEVARYEGNFKSVPVPFFDHNGRKHTYALNNSDTALFARYLKKLHPDMNISMRRAAADEVVA